MTCKRENNILCNANGSYLSGQTRWVFFCSSASAVSLCPHRVCGSVALLGQFPLPLPALFSLPCSTATSKHLGSRGKEAPKGGFGLAKRWEQGYTSQYSSGQISASDTKRVLNYGTGKAQATRRLKATISLSVFTIPIKYLHSSWLQCKSSLRTNGRTGDH